MAAALDIESGESPVKSQLAQGHGLRIAFKGLDYSVKSRTDKKDIKLLDNVTAYAEPYQMTALMGPSGSGKTTLLDVLAGRKTAGSISGEIRFGHAKPSAAFLRRYTGYVEQFDTLIGALTVSEMLMYTAELKRSVSEPRSSKQEAVRLLLERLGLTVCADVPIGDPLTKGISGGQAKRTNIGIALIANPRVLFLDEPTSGLDSFTANEVVSLMHSLSRDGTTVVATIHSPTASAFSLFDRVLMLVRGHTVYFGTREASLTFAQQHWAGLLGDSLAMLQQGESSLPEFLVDIITHADRDGKSAQLATAYQSSQLRKDNDEQAAAFVAGHHHHRSPSRASNSGKKSNAALPPVASGEDVHATVSSQDVSAVVKQQAVPASSSAGSLADDGEAAATLEAQLATRTSTSTPWWWGLITLLKYRARVNYKNPQWVGPRVADKFWFAFVIFTLYLQTGDDLSQNNLVNLCASLFMWCTLPAFGAVGYVPSIVLERKLFYRERADGLYHVGTYLAAKLVEELILATIISIIFSATVFYAVGYLGSFALFWLVYLLTLSNGIALAYLVAGISPSMDVANALLPAYVTGLLFFAGQLATFDSIPNYWKWFSRIDFIRYAWSSLMANQFGETDPVFTADGQTVLTYYSINGDNGWQYFALLFAFFGVFTFLGYMALSFIRYGSR